MYAGSIAARIHDWLTWHEGHDGPHIHAAEQWIHHKTVARTLADALKKSTMTLHGDKLTLAGVTIINSLYRGAAHIIETAPESKLRGRKLPFKRHQKATKELLRNFPHDSGVPEHIGTVTEMVIRLMGEDNGTR